MSLAVMRTFNRCSVQFMSLAIAMLYAAPLLASIVDSQPPDGAIDARVPHLGVGGFEPLTWDSVILVMDVSTGGLSPADFFIAEEGGDGLAPIVLDVNPLSAQSVELGLSAPIEIGAWTTITHMASNTAVRFAALPGDVNGDGATTPVDVLHLVDQINGVRNLPDYAADVDRSGIVDDADVFALSQLLHGGGGFQTWLNASLPDIGIAAPAELGESGVMAVVELTPRTMGPYDPGDTVTVDVLIRRNTPSNDILLRLMTYDFRDSNPLLTLVPIETHANGTEFWDFSSTPLCQAMPNFCAFGHFIAFGPPEFNMTFTGATANPDWQVTIPGDGSSLLQATIDVVLPPMSGTYVLDAMNYDTLNINDGARLDFDFENPTTWHVINGNFAGGVIDLVVGPGDPGGCCTPPEAPMGEGCINVTREECGTIVDSLGNPAVWQGGLLCDDSGQECVRWECQYAIGNCTEANGSPGCEDPQCCDDVCAQDAFCCEVDWTQDCAIIGQQLDACQFVPTGSCCEELFGECENDVTAMACLDSWTENVPCEDLDPECEPAPASCCAPDGFCADSTLATCIALGWTVLADGAQCEGDADGDGTDAECGDNCPNDENKVEPGVCGCGVSDVDTDEDDVEDCIDGCPQDPEKTEPGVCGCGVADIDSDMDGFLDCDDGCPNDPDKQDPGVCGCGVADVDSDGDMVEDCNDGCADDPAKTSPGICGCNVSDVDSDADGTPDCNDNCPTDPEKTNPGDCGCGTPDLDENGNGVSDCLDPNVVPAVTTWGLCILGLLLLVAAKLGRSKRSIVISS